GLVPSSVLLRALHFGLAGGLHPPLLAQPVDVTDVHLAPGRGLLALGIALQEIGLVERFADRVDPAPAERRIERLDIGHRGDARALLGELDPQLVLAGMVLLVPFPQGGGVLERMDRGRIDLELSHYSLPGRRAFSSAGSRRSVSSREMPMTLVSTSRISGTLVSTRVVVSPFSCVCSRALRRL